MRCGCWTVRPPSTWATPSCTWPSASRGRTCWPSSSLRWAPLLLAGMEQHCRELHPCVQPAARSSGLCWWWNFRESPPCALDFSSRSEFALRDSLVMVLRMFSFLINEQSWHTLRLYWQWKWAIVRLPVLWVRERKCSQGKALTSMTAQFILSLLMSKSTWAGFPGFYGSFFSRERQISCFAKLLHFFLFLAHFTDLLAPLFCSSIRIVSPHFWWPLLFSLFAL